MNTVAFLQNLGSYELAILLSWAVIIVLPFWKIFKRIGWPPPLSLLALIPGAIIVMLYVVAFGRWNNEELKG